MKGQQQVIVLLEGDDARIKAFLQLVEKNKPEMAEVSKVTFEEYDGDVGRASEVAMFCTSVQLDKAIPLLLKIQDNTSVTPPILEEIKGVGGGYAARLCIQFQTNAGRYPRHKRAARDGLNISILLMGGSRMSVNTYVDQKTCASCGGRCGKRHAGALFPSDSSFRLTQAPAVMAHGLLCAHTFHQIMQETPFAG